MVHKMVSLSQKQVALSHNQSSSLQFVQDMARHNNADSFFVADLGKIDSLVKKWFENLPRVKPLYAINCNSNELLLRVLASYPQMGFYVSSRQQLEVALDFAEADRLFYSNPCWTRNALLGAQSNNIELLGFDSEADLSRMAKNGMTNKLILNINMSNDDESVLGCNVNKAAELLQLSADFGLDCIGIGFNICNQRLGLFDSMIECAAQLFAIGRSMGLNMSVLNLGGGFPNVLSSNMASFEQICEQLNASLDYYFPMISDVEIVATPGRFFASSVFSLVTRIIDTFEVDASKITNDDFDAGKRAFVYKINEGYYGAFNCDNNESKCHPLFSDELQSEVFHGTIQGPQNDEFDVVQKQCQLREMYAGEWLIWHDMGSYTMNNCVSLDDDDSCNTPEIYYYSKENNWKFADDSEDGHSDGESVISSDESSSELGDTDPLWMMFDWTIV